MIYHDDRLASEHYSTLSFSDVLALLSFRHLVEEAEEAHLSCMAKPEQQAT